MGHLTTLFFTGEQQKNRKWVRINRLPKSVTTTVSLRKHRKAGSAKGKYVLAPDFNAPLADIKEYVQ